MFIVILRSLYVNHSRISDIPLVSLKTIEWNYKVKNASVVSHSVLQNYDFPLHVTHSLLTISAVKINYSKSYILSSVRLWLFQFCGYNYSEHCKLDHIFPFVYLHVCMFLKGFFSSTCLNSFGCQQWFSFLILPLKEACCHLWDSSAHATMLYQLSIVIIKNKERTTCFFTPGYILTKGLLKY